MLVILANKKYQSKVHEMPVNVRRKTSNKRDFEILLFRKMAGRETRYLNRSMQSLI